VIILGKVIDITG
jgi:hypothetical protein